ncbi:hypothetical protein [Ornithinimicrobium sp. LYQ103]|uniref:hypothetical protein n=1 Tax=Ornithinimicrobium sp. LYQ103 TaxID=3378796 RepID=UPI0038521593
MELSTRAQNAFVVGLAALAVGTSAFAVWTVSRPHPSLSEVKDEPTDAPAITHNTNDGAGTSGPDSQANTGDATPTATEEPGPVHDRAEPSDSEPPHVEGWIKAWADEADLLVIGDGYSNLPTQWVQLWGGDVGQERVVEIHHWGEARDVTFNDPVTLSEMDGPELSIWSASRAGTTIAEAAERVQRFVDVADELDAVIVSLGMDSEDEDIAESLDLLMEELDEDLPVLVAVGPPGVYAPGVADAVEGWAQDNDDRVSVVDLRAIAPENSTAEQWARAFQQAISEG